MATSTSSQLSLNCSQLRRSFSVDDGSLSAFQPFSPTAELGRDFEMLVLACILEKRQEIICREQQGQSGGPRTVSTDIITENEASESKVGSSDLISHSSPREEITQNVSALPENLPAEQRRVEEKPNDKNNNNLQENVPGNEIQAVTPSMSLTEDKHEEEEKSEEEDVKDEDSKENKGLREEQPCPDEDTVTKKEDEVTLEIKQEFRPSNSAPQSCKLGCKRKGCRKCRRCRKQLSQGHLSRWKEANVDLCQVEVARRCPQAETMGKEEEAELDKFMNSCEPESDSSRVKQEEKPAVEKSEKLVNKPIYEDEIYEDYDYYITDYEDRLSEKEIVHFEELMGAGGCDQRLRVKKKWYCQKAHKQVKTKYLYSVHNGGLGKLLYVHHRIARRTGWGMCVLPGLGYKPSFKRIDRHKGLLSPIRRPNPDCAYINNRDRSYPLATPAPANALTAYNADGDLSADLVNLLMTLQDRDLTPEDYDLLLRLDDRVGPKTLGGDVVHSLPTETVSETGENCAICMEACEMGQTRKVLPCGHKFHVSCIDNWLNNSSQNCPLDGLPVTTD